MLTALEQSLHTYPPICDMVNLLTDHPMSVPRCGQSLSYGCNHEHVLTAKSAVLLG